MNRERRGNFGAALAQRVHRPGNLKLGEMIEGVDANNLAAWNGAGFLFRVVGEKRERAEGAFEVNRPHAGDLTRVAFDRREIGGHANHRHRNSALAEKRPKWRPLAMRLDFAFRQWDYVVADFENFPASATCPIEENGKRVNGSR